MEQFDGLFSCLTFIIVMTLFFCGYAYLIDARVDGKISDLTKEFCINGIMLSSSLIIAMLLIAIIVPLVP